MSSVVEAEYGEAVAADRVERCLLLIAKIAGSAFWWWVLAFVGFMAGHIYGMSDGIGQGLWLCGVR